MHRRIIRITAEDSPNVRCAREELSKGINPSNTTVVPGILSYRKYRTRRATWDEVKQCIGLDARFWEGKDALMFPVEWLRRAARIALDLRKQGKKRTASALAIDPGEGTANTSLICCDTQGFTSILSRRTSDTSEITDMVIDFARQNGIGSTDHSSAWVLDAGGGGKQHKDRLVRMGYRGVTVIAFGSAPAMIPKHGKYTVAQRLNLHEERNAYISRRAQMYFELRCLIDPSINPNGFGIPYGPPKSPWGELHRQLSLIPLWYDQNGKVVVPPKQRKQGMPGRSQGGLPTLTEIIGNSPDEADAAVMAAHRMLHGSMRAQAGVSSVDSINRPSHASHATVEGTYSKPRPDKVDARTGRPKPLSQSEAQERLERSRREQRDEGDE